MTLAADGVWSETVGETVSTASRTARHAQTAIIGPAFGAAGVAAERPAVSFGEVDGVAAGVWPTAHAIEAVGLRMAAAMSYMLDAATAGGAETDHSLSKASDGLKEARVGGRSHSGSPEGKTNGKGNA
jgi:hypothetical protein